jgi:hypothetical protein
VIGALIVVVVTAVVIPVLLLVGGAVVAALFGESMRTTAEHDHAGSELVDLNR